MSEKNFQAVARVQVTLEFAAEGVWGGDCTVAQIQKQAADHIRNKIMQGFTIDGMGFRTDGERKTDCSIVGEPKIITYIVEEKR